MELGNANVAHHVVRCAAPVHNQESGAMFMEALRQVTRADSQRLSEQFQRKGPELDLFLRLMFRGLGVRNLRH
jgi:hypothetical protein